MLPQLHSHKSQIPPSATLTLTQVPVTTLTTAGKTFPSMPQALIIFCSFPEVLTCLEYNTELLPIFWQPHLTLFIGRTPLQPTASGTHSKSMEMHSSCSWAPSLSPWSMKIPVVTPVPHGTAPFNHLPVLGSYLWFDVLCVAWIHPRAAGKSHPRFHTGAQPSPQHSWF